MEQAGYIFRAGDYWYLRYRDTVIENGAQTRKQLLRRLERVAPEDRRLKRPPQNVVELGKDFLRPLNANKLTPESTQALGDFVEKVYFPHAEQDKRASTLLTDRNRWKTHLKPRCEGIRLRDFRTVDGQNLIAAIARQNNLSRATLAQFKSLLSAVFAHAKRVGFIDGENPMRGVSIPTKNVRPKQKTYAYTLDEVRQMLSLLPEPAATIVAVAAFAGLRRGEIQGLTWGDYTGTQLQIERSIWEGIAGPPKSEESQGAVPVINILRTRLENYRSLLGDQSPRTPMFCAGNGKAMRLNNLLRQAILPVLNRCETCRKLEADHEKADHKYRRDTSVPAWHGWHAFRRGLATTMHDLGIDDLTVKSILRHSDVSVTQKSYIKTMPQQSITAMDAVDAEYTVCNDCATTEAETGTQTIQ